MPSPTFSNQGLVSSLTWCQPPLSCSPPTLLGPRNLCPTPPSSIYRLQSPCYLWAFGQWSLAQTVLLPPGNPTQPPAQHSQVPSFHTNSPQATHQYTACLPARKESTAVMRGFKFLLEGDPSCDGGAVLQFLVTQFWSWVSCLSMNSS